MMNQPWITPGNRPKSHNMVLMNRSDPTPRDWDHQFYDLWWQGTIPLRLKRTSDHVSTYLLAIVLGLSTERVDTHTGIIGKMSAITQSPALVPPSAGSSAEAQRETQVK